VRDLSCGDMRIFLEFEVRRVLCRPCGKVKRERLEFLADNPFYTKRFAYFVGRRCRQTTIKDLAKELCLDWDTVKALDLCRMRHRSSHAERQTMPSGASAALRFAKDAIRPVAALKGSLGIALR
jgi:transposase